MKIDSTDLIRKLPAMIQSRKKFAKMSDGGNYHVGKVDDWCLTFSEVVKAIEDYCEYKVTNKYRLSAPVNESWNVLEAYPYKADVPDTNDGKMEVEHERILQTINSELQGRNKQIY